MTAVTSAATGPYRTPGAYAAQMQGLPPTEESSAGTADFASSTAASPAPAGTSADTPPLSAETADALFRLTRGAAASSDTATTDTATTDKTTTNTKTAAAPGNDAEATFLKFMRMSPQELYIALKLEQRGYTKEEFDALPPKEREKILEEIRQEMRKEIEQQAKSGKVGKTGAADAVRASSPASPSTFGEIAAKYDVTGISPRGVDRLAAELQNNDAAPFKDILMLMTHGEKFLSHLPGTYYSGDRLTAKTDLLATAKAQRDMGAGPKKGWDDEIAFLEKLQAGKLPERTDRADRA